MMRVSSWDLIDLMEFMYRLFLVSCLRFINIQTVLLVFFMSEMPCIWRVGCMKGRIHEGSDAWRVGCVKGLKTSHAKCIFSACRNLNLNYALECPKRSFDPSCIRPFISCEAFSMLNPRASFKIKQVIIDCFCSKASVQPPHCVNAN